MWSVDPDQPVWKIRCSELGCAWRLAATRANILRLVLAQTAWLTIVGRGVGILGALALARLIATQLYEISPRDSWTFIVTAITPSLVALTAAGLPTRRATSVDPVVTLRAE